MLGLATFELELEEKNRKPAEVGAVNHSVVQRICHPIQVCNVFQLFRGDAAMQVIAFDMEQHHPNMVDRP
jgi:hypothetical protein